jgi:hypothetical protein
MLRLLKGHVSHALPVPLDRAEMQELHDDAETTLKGLDRGQLDDDAEVILFDLPSQRATAWMAAPELGRDSAVGHQSTSQRATPAVAVCRQTAAREIAQGQPLRKDTEMIGINQQAVAIAQRLEERAHNGSSALSTHGPARQGTRTRHSGSRRVCSGNCRTRRSSVHFGDDRPDLTQSGISFVDSNSTSCDSAAKPRLKPPRTASPRLRFAAVCVCDLRDGGGHAAGNERGWPRNARDPVKRVADLNSVRRLDSRRAKEMGDPVHRLRPKPHAIIDVLQ